jgi:hypothetical protein
LSLRSNPGLELANAFGVNNEFTPSALIISSRMQVEDLVYDLPFAVDFEKREHVSETISGPVLEFEPHGRHALDDVDAGDPSLQLCGWSILFIPVE